MNVKSIIPVITIDGPSGTGKGTLCHMLAHHLNWHVLDSGCLYRVLAYAAKKNRIDLAHIPPLVELAYGLNVRFEMDPHIKTQALLDNENVFDAIRTEECGLNASKIAVYPEVRQALLERQRAFAELPGLVTDGRDMGTVVFPDAILKIYLHASAEIRAERRYFQLKESQINVSLAQVVDELAERDRRDSSRLCAPLKPAKDSVEIDTTRFTIVQVFNYVLELINKHSFFANRG